MEDLGQKIGIGDRKLRRYFVFYGVAAVIFLVILSATILVAEYARSFDDTARNLERIRQGLVRIEHATKDMKQSISAVERVVPVRLFTESPERQILIGLDDLKTNIKGSRITISDFTTDGNRLLLPLSIKGHVTDYSLFVNDVGRLQEMRFPFVNVQTITVKKEDEGPDEKKPIRIIYEITAELTTLSVGEKGASAPSKPADTPRARPSWPRKDGA